MARFWWGMLTAIGLVMLGPGCKRDTPDWDSAGLRESFADFADKHQSCRAAEDCAVVYPGCPLGCWVAVNEESKAVVKAKAAEVIQAFQEQSAPCEYTCTPPPQVECAGGECAFDRAAYQP